MPLYEPRKRTPLSFIVECIVIAIAVPCLIVAVGLDAILGRLGLVETRR